MARGKVMEKIVRGDIIYVDLGQHPKSSVQSGMQLCVVVSNNKNNTYSTTLNVCPFTRRRDKKFIPIHVKVCPEDINGFLKAESVMLAEQIVTVDKRNIVCKVAHIDENTNVMRQLDAALLRQLELGGRR